MSSTFHVTERIIPASHIREFAHATSLSQDEELVQHVKQYTPKDNPNPQKGDVTIIGAHANGFPKELYEPLWEDLYRELKPRGIRIRSIIIADAVWQGQSSILNGSKLGNDPSWKDYSRDIIHMVNTLRPPRPLLGMGHSFGAAAIALTSLTSPRLFFTMALLDPVISRYASTPVDGHAPSPASMSVHRRDVWPSRAAANASFTRSAFYSTWDPRALERWSAYGITPTNEDDPDGEVRLATTKHQEVFTYMRPSWDAYDAEGNTIINRNAAPDLDHYVHVDPSTGNLSRITWPLYRPEPPYALSRLPNVRPSVLYVFGVKSEVSPPELREEKLRITGTGLGGSGGAEAGRVKAVVSDDCGHLVPMEKPGFCAGEVAAWLGTELDRWWAEEKAYEEWTNKSQTEKSTVSDEYKKHLAPPRPRKKADSKM